MRISFIVIFTIVIAACTNSGDGTKQFGNQLSSIGRNSSFEDVAAFQSQLANQIALDSTTGATTPPLLLSDGQIIIGAENETIYSSLKNSVNWTFKLDSGSLIGAGFTADANNNIYAIDITGNIYSLDKFGKQRFKRNLFGEKKLEIFNTPLSIDDITIFSSTEGKFCIIDSKGKELFRTIYSTGILNYVSAIDKQNILVTLSNDVFGQTDTLISMQSNGKENWRFSSKGYRLLKGAITNGQYIALAGTKTGGDNPLSKIFYLDQSGKLLWEKEISTIPRYLSMANNGELYLVSFSSGMGQMLSGIFSYDSDGELRWKIFYDYSIPMPIYIGAEQLVFLASNRETYGLFYMQRADGKLINMLDIGNTHPINFIPEVGDDGTLIFAGKENLRVIRIDQTAINKILPY